MPVAVDRVAVEAAAEVVVHAAQGHGVQGVGGHRPGAGTGGGSAAVTLDELQQGADDGRAGKLGRAAKAAPFGVISPLANVQKVVADLRPGKSGGCPAGSGAALELI